VVNIYSKDGKQSDANSEISSEYSESEGKENNSHQADSHVEPHNEVDPQTESGSEFSSEHSESDKSEVNESSDEFQSLQQKIADLEDAVLREKAENQNTRKRLHREIEAARDSGVEKLIREFLPVKDSLDLGLANLDNATELESVKTGIELTLKMTDDFLGKLEISKIDPKNEPFNPEEHQAMSVETTDLQPPNTVLKVFQVGYKLKNRLIRPAMVVVSAKEKN